MKFTRTKKQKAPGLPAARPETAARCHRPPEWDSLTMAAPLVRCLGVAMFDGHPLALTG